MCDLLSLDKLMAKKIVCRKEACKYFKGIAHLRWFKYLFAFAQNYYYIFTSFILCHEDLLLCALKK